MSDMSRASAPSGGDPLDLTGEVGTDDDVLPGPPGGVDVGEGTAEEVPSGESDAAVDADPVSDVDADATPDPPGRTMNIDPAAGNDPLDDADAEGMRPPGVGDSAGGSDPMPDMSGTTD
jgi:hypothetical protein